MTIHILPDILINQIAAGEVVDRPVSIVRELVDNALDAGARAIEISLEAGGKQLVRVADDGCGIPQDEAELAFTRHATSKIASFDELIYLQTRGFRGEALPSIASVSRVRLITRAEASQVAWEVTLDGGRLVSANPARRTRGTTVEVYQLFHNVPVRRKFLKADRTEEAKVLQYVLEIALGAPQVSFRVITDGRERRNLVSRSSFAERAQDIFSGPFVAFADEIGEVTVAGRIAHPAVAAEARGEFVILVNNRVVSDRVILRAVREGFQSSLKEREQPVGCISINLPPSGVDFNVHPQKREARFTDPQALFRIVHRCVSAAFAEFRAPFVGNRRGKDGVSQSGYVYGSGRQGELDEIDRPDSRRNDLSSREVIRTSRFAFQSPETTSLHPAFGVAYRISSSNALSSLERSADELAAVESGNKEPGALALGSRPKLMPDDVISSPLPDHGQEERSFAYRELRYVGQVLDTFLICEAPTRNLVLIDMHAAHERVNFNEIVRRWREEPQTVQELLLPITMKIDPSMADACAREGDMLRELGFNFNLMGEESLSITSIPARLAARGFSAREVIQLFGEFCTAAARDIPPSILEGIFIERAARLACHASIRSGDRLSRESVYALLEALDREETSAACPHGRPVSVTLDFDEIANLFHRD